MIIFKNKKKIVNTQPLFLFLLILKDSDPFSMVPFTPLSNPAYRVKNEL